MQLISHFVNATLPLHCLFRALPIAPFLVFRSMPSRRTTLKPPAAARQGIQSVEVAGPLLQALVTAEGPMMLRDLAAVARMPAAKAHRYLVSLARLHLVEQDQATGRYDLGPFALALGLSALNRLDAIKPASKAIEHLRDQLGETAGVVTWGTHGPTYIRIAEPLRPVTVALRAGATAPLTASAAGFVFLAHLPETVTAPVLKRETSGKGISHAHTPLKQAIRSGKQLATVVQRVRKDGVACAISAYAPGVNSYAAPVFDHMGRLVFALTVIGYAAHLGSSPDTAVAKALRQAAQAVSAQLGFR